MKANWTRSRNDCTPLVNSKRNTVHRFQQSKPSVKTSKSASILSIDGMKSYPNFSFRWIQPINVIGNWLNKWVRFAQKKRRNWKNWSFVSAGTFSLIRPVLPFFYRKVLMGQTGMIKLNFWFPWTRVNYWNRWPRLPAGASYRGWCLGLRLFSMNFKGLKPSFLMKSMQEYPVGMLPPLVKKCIGSPVRRRFSRSRT